MNRFTAEEVRKIVTNLDDLVAPITREGNIALNRAAAALRAYADTLSKPADSGRVTSAMVAQAITAFGLAIGADNEWGITPTKDKDDWIVGMRAAIRAALAAQGQGDRRCPACVVCGDDMVPNYPSAAPPASPAGVPEVSNRHLAIAGVPSKYWDEARKAYELAAAPSAPEGGDHE